MSERGTVGIKRTKERKSLTQEVLGNGEGCTEELGGSQTNVFFEKGAKSNRIMAKKAKVKVKRRQSTKFPVAAGEGSASPPPQQTGKAFDCHVRQTCS